MAIARKPSSKPAAAPEDAAEQFIARAGAPAAPADPPDQASTVATGTSDRRQPAMIRFDRMLLARVDRAARRRGISRSAWIQYTLSKALDEEDAPA